jgi:hypothetical protein
LSFWGQPKRRAGISPLVRIGVPFALVKSSLDLDALRDEATGIYRSKFRAVPFRMELIYTARKPYG